MPQMWDDARKARVLKLWAEGLSASEIAKRVGAVSRSAIIGLVHRNTTARRVKPAAPSKPRPLAAPRRVLFAPPVKKAGPNPLGAPKAVAVKKARANAKPPKPAAVRPAIVFGPGVHVGPQTAALIKARTEAPGLATVMTIGPHMCRWPIGDPASDDFTLCGARQKDGKPYCTGHDRIAYQPQQPKRSTRVDDIGGPYRRRRAA